MTKATDDESAPSPTAATGRASTSPTVPDPIDRAKVVAADVSRASLPGYRIRGPLGRGGMGEVVAARDERIGRDVAIKRMLGAAPSPGAVARFLREARIQARLEHPAIVPVHEVGRDADDQPYFAMKRLTGGTLKELLAVGSSSLQSSLRVFADVCSAIAFAHSHGVIHRDLKPDNVAVGDFGEVYVLDWGLARALDERDPVVVALELDSLDGMTQVGSVMGTPGYMAPEQVSAAAEVGLPADIYALGAILFEILAGESLRGGDSIAAPGTPVQIETSVAQRHPERGVPPELDALCGEALASDPSARPTARQLAERVEHYLDGDRDLEQRRGLAAAWLAKARAALASDPVHRRAEAVQSAGRALTLDPESRDAADLVTRLILEPPARLPPELSAELASSEVAVQRRQSRVATMSYVAVAAFLVMASWNGLRNGMLMAGVAALATLMAAAAFWLSRRAALRREMIAVAAGNALLAALLSRAFGPLILAPAVICVMAVSLTSYPQLIDHARLVIGVLVLSWVVPVALEAAGVLDATWRVVDGQVISTSSLLQIGKISTTALLVGANVITIVVVGMFANALARSRRDAQRQVEIQAWHLRQLLPST